MSSSAGPLLDANQARHVLSVLRHLDDLLDSVAGLTYPDTSPFSATRPDFAEHEAALLRAAIVAARTDIVESLAQLGLPRPDPYLSARHSAEVTIRFAEIALADLGEPVMRGYGPLTPEVADRLRSLGEHLRILFRRAVALLHEQDAGGLSHRLERLPGVPGQILRELDRLSAAHALSEIRPLLAAAAERAEATTLEIGVFGRVSSGKSSLMNALAGTAILPVGATPITAVPVRIRHGPLAFRLIEPDGAARQVSREVAERAMTLTGGSDPSAEIRRIDINVPTLSPGLSLLDTPGVGTLSSAAPALAYASLPRCDLGLVLVAAGTPVSRDEVSLVAGLENAGIPCQVLISKSDLLSPLAMEATLGYVTRELTTTAHLEHLPLRPISALPAQSSTVVALRTEVIEPLLLHRATARSAMLERRLRRLLVATDLALTERQSLPAAGASRARAGLIARARSAAREATQALPRNTARILALATDPLIDAWQTNQDPVSAARRVVIDAAAQAAGRVRKLIATTEDRELGESRVPPLFDARLLGPLAGWSRPRIKARWWLQVQARRRLRALSPLLTAALEEFASRLEVWAGGQIDRAAEQPGQSAVDPGALSTPELQELEALLQREGHHEEPVPRWGGAAGPPVED